MSGVHHVNVIASVKTMAFVIRIQENVHANQDGLVSTVNCPAQVGHTVYSVIKNANVKMEVFVIELTGHAHVLKIG